MFPVYHYESDDHVLSGTYSITSPGQQRITAIMTAIIGLEVLDSDFNKKRIKISFNPFAKGDDDVFKVQDNAVLKDKRWIADISDVFNPDFKRGSFVSKYCEVNPEMEIIMNNLTEPEKILRDNIAMNIAPVIFN